MRCKKVERLLSDYANNSLNTDVRNEIKTHLAECSKCADYFSAMNKLDNLLKLKVQEKPVKGYFENYWSKLESRLTEYPTTDRVIIQQRFNERRWANIFIPKFSSAFSGILIALLIFVNGLLYMQIRQVTSIQSVIVERQEEMQQEISRYLTKAVKTGYTITY